VQGCAVEGVLNCLFTIIALPLGLFLLGYGVYLIFQARTDAGIFLILLGILLLGAVASGVLTAKARKGRKTKGSK